MRPLILTTFFFFLTVFAFGQERSLKYKPKNIDEAIVQLDKLIDDTSRQNIQAMTENEFIANSHFGLGMWIRNNWGLWKGRDLSKYFNSIGIYHPDDISGIILTSYYRHLKGQDRGLEEQIKHYQDYWKTSAEHNNRLETDTVYQIQMQQEEDSLNNVHSQSDTIIYSNAEGIKDYPYKKQLQRATRKYNKAVLSGKDIESPQPCHDLFYVNATMDSIPLDSAEDLRQ